MTELPNFGEHLPNPEVATIETIKSTLEDWRVKPTGDDEAIAAFAEAALLLLDYDNEFHELVSFMLDFRNDPEGFAGHKKLKGPKQVLTAEIACNLLLRAISFEKWKMENNILILTHEDLGRLEEFNYDHLEGHEKVEKWIETFLQIYESPRSMFGTNRFDSLGEILSWRIIQSNRPERYAGFKLGLDVYEDELPKEMRVVEIGSSLGEGFKKILSGDDFDDIEVRISYESDPNSDVSEKVNLAINKTRNIEYVINNDLFPFNTPEDILWLIISSHYPKEFKEKDKLRDFLRLAKSQFDNLGFVRGDAAGSDFVAKVKNEYKKISSKKLTKNKKPEIKKPNIAFLCTVMYEGSEEERQHFFDNLVQILEPDEKTAIFVQDLIEADSTQPFGVRVGDNFRIKGAYKIAVYFPFRENPGPEIFMVWDQPRCKAGTLVSSALKKYVAHEH